MAAVAVSVYLYGSLASRTASKTDYGYANLQVNFSRPSTIRELLAHLGIPTTERGITFINGRLSAMPGVQPDLEHTLANGDRVAFFDLRSMWPFQYRDGAPMIEEMKNAVPSDTDGTRHSYEA